MKPEQYRLFADIEQKHWWFLGRRTIMRALVNHAVPPDRSATVVDIGCGTGGNIAALADEYSCVGIDPSPEAIRFAQSRFPSVRFLCGHAPADLPDAVRHEARLYLLMDVIEHVPDDFAFVSEVLGAMRPGAHLLITVPADASLWSAHDANQSHYRRYDLSCLARLWQGLPVRTRLISYFNSRLYRAIKLARTVSRWRGESWGSAGMDFALPTKPVNYVLESIFAGEAKRLVGALDGKARQGFSHGVSIVALLQREAGDILPRTTPADLAPDGFAPQAGRGW